MRRVWSRGRPLRGAAGTGALALVLGTLAWTGEATAGETVVLTGGSSWRKHYAFFPPQLDAKAAKDAGVAADEASLTKALSSRCRKGFVTELPPAGWTEPGFDDSDWLPRPGTEFFQGDSRISRSAPKVYRRCTDPGAAEMGLVSMRGKFIVHEPARVGRITLSLTYRGGFVAYLNGKEVARGHLPNGKVKPKAPAEVYPIKAFIAPDGKPLHWYNHRQANFHEQWGTRERKKEAIAIPKGLVRKGVNVLAIEFHRSAYPAECRRKKTGLCFASAGLCELKLAMDAPADSVVSADAVPAKLTVWNCEPWSPVSNGSRPSPAEGLRPVKIPAVRNGVFHGKVIVSSNAPVSGLKASVGDLIGPGGAKIPSSNVMARYAVVNPLHGKSGVGGTGSGRFDMLMETPPAKIEPVAPAASWSLPVWMIVRVPKGAAAGEYRGTLTISAKGLGPVRASVLVTVSDWTLPDVKDYTPPTVVYQSPETLARRYNVERWSEKHWALIERSLRMMGEFGNSGLIMLLTAESCHGNPESWVVWKKKPGGGYEHDFSIFDRYLDTALKYHDPKQLRMVALNIWGNECSVSRKAAAAGAKAHRAQVTLQEGAKKRTMKLPPYGTPECEAMLRPMLVAAAERLKKRGLGRIITWGVGNDRSPSVEHVAMLNRILPGTPWFRESHFNAHSYRYDANDKSKKIPVRLNSIVWGGEVPDPAKKRLYGWKCDPKHMTLNFNRAGASSLVLKGFPGPWCFRMWMESTIAAGRNGNGRVGGDFFSLGINLRSLWKGTRARSENIGGSSGTLYGTYPHSAVGQTGLGNSTTDLFGPGPDGPVTTVRLENGRAGNQETEARVFIEKALLGKKVPEALAKECQDLLDRRTTALRMWQLDRGRIPFGAFEWREMNRRLFECAARVGGGKTVVPSKRSAAAPAAPAAPAARGAAARAATAAAPGRDDGPAAKLYRLARDAEKRGHRDMARQFYRRVVLKYPHSTYAGKARERIGSFSPGEEGVPR